MGFRWQMVGGPCRHGRLVCGLRDCFHRPFRPDITSTRARSGFAGSVLQDLHPRICRLRCRLECGMVRVSVWVGRVVGVAGGKCCPGSDGWARLRKFPPHYQSQCRNICSALSGILSRREIYSMAGKFTAWSVAGWTHFRAGQTLLGIALRIGSRRRFGLRLLHFSRRIRADRPASGWQRRFFRFMKPTTFQGLSIPLERCKFIAYDNAWF